MQITRRFTTRSQISACRCTAARHNHSVGRPLAAAGVDRASQRDRLSSDIRAGLVIDDRLSCWRFNRPVIPYKRKQLVWYLNIDYSDKSEQIIDDEYEEGAMHRLVNTLAWVVGLLILIIWWLQGLWCAFSVHRIRIRIYQWSTTWLCITNEVSVKTLTRWQPFARLT